MASGLSNFISNSATQSTSMPAWYDKAQQDIVSGATTAAKDIPALADTSAGAAIEQFKKDSTTTPFKNAQSTFSRFKCHQRFFPQ